jgi:hypothetical protein
MSVHESLWWYGVKVTKFISKLIAVLGLCGVGLLLVVLSIAGALAFSCGALLFFTVAANQPSSEVVFPMLMIGLAIIVFTVFCAWGGNSALKKADDILIANTHSRPAAHLAPAKDSLLRACTIPAGAYKCELLRPAVDRNMHTAQSLRGYSRPVPDMSVELES